MVEESTNLKNEATVWEPYEFIIKINNTVICQQFIEIPNFKRDSLVSLEFNEVMRKCVNLIKDNLKKKSRLFSWCVSPITVRSKEEAQQYLTNHTAKRGNFIIIDNDNNSVDTFVVGDNGLEPYNGFYRMEEFSTSIEKPKSTIEFGFNYRGRRIFTEAWDANVYPKFVRSNIDITNNNNRYQTEEGVSVWYDALMVDYLNEDNKNDLTPIISDMVREVCSFKDASDYTQIDYYSSKTYNMNIHRTNRRRIREWEDSVANASKSYFKSIGVKYTAPYESNKK